MNSFSKDVDRDRDFDTDSKTVFLHHARDALIYFELVADQLIEVELRGTITKVRKHKNVVFCDFEDATGSLQLLVRRKRFDDKEWTQINDIKSSDRVIAKGLMGRSRTGEPSVFLVEIPHPLKPPERVGNRTVRDLDQVGARLFLARLRYKAETFFRADGFLQIEPNFISTSWYIDGIEPLRVEYEGFGVPAYLTPSPSPQLLAAMEATGSDRVFAVGRVFTTTYRDETTSAESLILMAKIAHCSIDDLVAVCIQALLATLGDPETMPENYTKLTKRNWHQSILREPPPPATLSVESPMLQIYELPIEDQQSIDSGINSVTILRACWPSRSVLAEGSIRRLSGQIGDGTLTLFLERMVPLLKDVPLRQIRDLQRTGS